MYIQMITVKLLKEFEDKPVGTFVYFSNKRARALVTRGLARFVTKKEEVEWLNVCLIMKVIRQWKIGEVSNFNDPYVRKILKIITEQ